MTIPTLAGAEERPPEPAAPGPQPAAARANLYVARMLQQHLVDDPSEKSWASDGSAVLIDISGFTKLSEALARKGREGAEQITELIGHIFELMLAVAYDSGGSLLKFGGDALLLWFEGDGHAPRACRSTLLMRDVLREVGTIELPGVSATLRMSQGVHSGRFHFFAVGSAHLELLPVGPAWSRLVAMQHAAEPDEILVSAETAASVPPDCVGEPKGLGRVLQQEPPGYGDKMPRKPRPQMSAEAVAQCLPPAIRTHVLGGGGIPEHRPVTVAFIRFEGTDALIEERGAPAAADALHRLLSVVETAVDEQGVSFLASDVDADGGKLILTGGAPKATGNDEERMLLALRKIISTELPIAVRIGVHRGAVFAGDIGPFYRRTYTVMGDAVNLAARLMARADPGKIYATTDVLDRSNTVFEAERLEPFAVKGKTEPVQAWAVGRAQSSKARQVSSQRLPLTGRNAELGVIRKAFASARSGAGRLIEVVGDSGIGKTRLLEALRDAAAGLNKQHATCEAYTASAPYAVWSELLREYMKFGREDPEMVIAERLREEIVKSAPDLAPWLPLIAVAFGLEVAATPEVEMLAQGNRRAKVHESVARFLTAVMPGPQLIEIENAHHMDEASAELLSYLLGEIGTHPWLFALARQGSKGFVAPETETVVRIELKPLAPPDALRLAQLATQQTPLAGHVLEVVATRSGGNPQFLRDLLQKVVDSGGIADLPDSAEAAAMAQIDSLSPEDRTVVRHASVFGLTFHPRMLAWFVDDEFSAPAPAVWDRLGDWFDQEPDGYLRFRRTLLRESAYQGLPYRLRRKLHGAIAKNLEEELDYPEDMAGILSLHYLEAGEYEPTWRYAIAAAKRAASAYADIEAAGLYGRALQAGSKLTDLGQAELAGIHQAMGDAWYRAGEFAKASETYTHARPLVANDPLADGGLLLKLSHVEEKLGNYTEALRRTEQVCEVLKGLSGPEAARQTARSAAWYAMLLQAEGRTTEALEWAEKARVGAEAADDADALGDAYFVMGWAYADRARQGGSPLTEVAATSVMLNSIEAYQRSGNAVREAQVLGTLGSIYLWEGRWDDALTYFERGRNAALKIGSAVDAAVTRVNIAEILVDRGEWAEAEAMLLETLPVWKASQYHYFLGHCQLHLGRVSLRMNRLDEALARLDGARAAFLHVGAEKELPAVDARIAECRIAMGKPDEGLELVRGMLGNATESNGVASVVPLLERVQGHGLLRQGDLWGARDALEASLAAAKERNDLFEATLTMLSLIELDRLEGIEPPIEMLTETRSVLASWKIRAVPPVPLPAA